MKRRVGMIALTLAGLGLGIALGPGARRQVSGPDPVLLTGAMRFPEVASGRWVDLGGAPGDEPEIEVSRLPNGDLRLEFALPGLRLRSAMVAGRRCSRVDVPGLVKLRVAGLPELPMASTSLATDATGEIKFKIVDQVELEIAVDPVEPSQGYLTRDIDPATVTANFAAFYDEGGVWPPQAVTSGPSFRLGEQAGAGLRLNPLRYDADRGVLLVTERIVIEVTGAAPAGKSLPRGSPALSAMQSLVFGSSLPAAPDKYASIATPGRMLILAPTDLADAVGPLVNWKRRRGIPTDLVTVSDQAANTAAIANLIKSAYQEPQGLTWVILVGDRQQMPPATGLYDGSDSDTRYAMVSGDDIYPDLFISRISATTQAEVTTQINKFIRYERQPTTGFAAAWYRRATTVASADGTPSDTERAELLRADLEGGGFAPVDQIYQNQGGTTEQIRSALDAGASLVNYLGHGTGVSWESVPFHDYDLPTLSNNDRLPWIVDVSCYNGEIARDVCFAEAWLRAGTPDSPSGAVGMIAASSLAPWTPPTVMQGEVVDLLVAGQAHTLGGLYYSGLMRVADLYAGLPVAVRVVEQNIVFGDCSLQVRTMPPSEFVVSCPGAVAVTDGSLALDVAGPAGAVIALTSGDELLAVAGLDSTSSLVVPFGDWAQQLTNFEVTITGFNMVPWTGSVELTHEALASSAVPDQTASRVTLLGNYPNPFNPSTRIAFDLSVASPVKLVVYDIRGHLVRDLSVGRLPAGRNEVAWDGRDDRGMIVAGGVYLYRLAAGGQTLSGRMTLGK